VTAKTVTSLCGRFVVLAIAARKARAGTPVRSPPVAAGVYPALVALVSTQPASANDASRGEIEIGLIMCRTHGFRWAPR
jgi:hypothetical protein